MKLNKIIISTAVVLLPLVFAQAADAIEAQKNADQAIQEMMTKMAQGSQEENQDLDTDKSSNTSRSIQSSPRSSNKSTSKPSSKKGINYANTPIPKGAKKVTLAASVNVKVIEDKYSILDFPFLITSVDFGEFKGSANQDSVGLPDLEAIKGKDYSPIKIEQTDNRLVINSSVRGKAQLVVWGGDFPVVINLYINKNDGSTYYKFLDANNEQAKIAIKKLESNEHERVINILTTALYRDQIPRGYEKNSKKELYRYKKEEIKIIKDYSLQGRFYIAEKWDLINTSKKKTLNLYEEMFYTPDDTYSVSILSPVLEPMRSTSIYIIKRNNKPQ
ncbi:hypothetical protein BKH46_08610 [Helicobacter sp. 12S02634-8]|uniref:TraK domain-containing protein n=1 Tax=Helicobacter sp. 12S02634-8 TaxID=1476199 RepID=UPI000BA6BB8B|nr:type-F conjugative transfer system secretin TraK [Helicobacter sp. 12S02634-8]PAF46188.1 hypothetical protein BKH46_08610 [Helicobacter sp. 12S02634-8]